jgi:hypothetical protein
LTISVSDTNNNGPDSMLYIYKVTMHVYKPLF